MALITTVAPSLLSSTGCCGSGITGLGFIEVIIGTPEADALGLVDGETRFTDPALINRWVEVHRNCFLQPTIDWGGSTYITKVLQYSYFDFSIAIVDGELIKIKLI
jgi:hypothetical protein